MLAVAVRVYWFMATCWLCSSVNLQIDDAILVWLFRLQFILTTALLSVRRDELVPELLLVPVRFKPFFDLAVGIVIVADCHLAAEILDVFLDCWNSLR